MYGNGVENLKKGEPTSMMKVDMGASLITTVGLVERVDQVVRGKRRFTISELSEEFPEISRSALYTIVSKT